MEPSKHSRDPSLAHLRALLAAGDVEAARSAALELSDAGRAELEARIGKPAVERMLRVSRRVRETPRGRVVVLHGIMGGQLASIDAAGDDDLVWVNVFRLLGGRIGDFALDAAGQPAKPGLRVETRGLLDEYIPIVFELGQHWQVLPFAYDWRLDIDKAAAALDQQVRRWANGQPVHIVAHSMGGLVARRFMQLFPQTWNTMKDPDGLKRGGRLVMLGTPNRGSFAIPLVLTGQEGTVRNLARLDLKHDLAQLLAIVDTFPGSYQMLPSPKLAFGDERLRLFEQQTWGGLPVPQALLEKGRRFQEELDAVKDPERLLYVAGYGQPTPCRIRIDAPGSFSYQQTTAGDGRVPHELGLLPEVRTFYVREKHGDLPSNGQVLQGIHELLSMGTTEVLPSIQPVARAVEAPAAWVPAGELPPLAPEIPLLPQALRSAAGAQLAPADQAALEAAFAATVLGGGGEHAREWAGAQRPALAPQAAAAAPRTMARATTAREPVALEVMWADITQVDGEVLAAGHYEGVEPFAGELMIDRAISGVRRGQPYTPQDLVITAHTRRGTLRGAVGDINFFPWRAQARSVAIAGMGHPGSFNAQALRRATRALAESVAALPDLTTVNTLLIGAGNGNMAPERAAAAMLDGLCDVLPTLSPHSPIRRIRIVEWDLRKAQRIAQALRQRADGELTGMRIDGELKHGPGGRIGDDIALSALLLGAARRAGGKPEAAGKFVGELLQGLDAPQGLSQRCAEVLLGLAGGSATGDLLARSGLLNFGLLGAAAPNGTMPTRICFVRDPAGILSSAISDTAVVAERIVPLDWGLVQEIVQRTTDPADAGTVKDMGGLMTHLFVPRDFREKVQVSDSIVLELDRETGRIHWEMMESFDERNEKRPIGLDRPVARQLRTAYSTAPPRALVPGATLRALVIGDPGDPDQGYGLPGARREALEVARILRSHGVEVDLLVGAATGTRAAELEGIAPATMLEVLRLLDRNTYDILHYAGHADFDPDDPEHRAGWLFGKRFFTARELAGVTHIPSLVVANACLSALTSTKLAGADGPRSSLRGADEDLLPGLVDEFFRRGVRNYIGTAWPVNDAGAVLFCSRFYELLLAQAPGAPAPRLGDALLQARLALHEREASYGALWAAYQHYGDPTFTVRYRAEMLDQPDLTFAVAPPAAPAGKRKQQPRELPVAARRAAKRPPAGRGARR